MKLSPLLEVTTWQLLRYLEIRWWDWPMEKINDNLEIICSPDLAKLFEIASRPS